MGKGTLQDQTAYLKNILNEIERGESDQKVIQDDLEPEPVKIQKIDILNLPPRKEIHDARSNRIQLKLGKPLIRLLLVVVIFSAIIIGAYYLWDDAFIQIIKDL